MKKIKLIPLFILFASTTYSQQNLVLNPSFEDTVTYDDFNIHYEICKKWVNPNGSTPDYFSPYCQELGWGNEYCSPQTWLGFQQAQDGFSFIGLDIYEPNTSLSKEYAQGFLSQPLIQGKKYDVSMYINLVNNTEYKSCEIDVVFTNNLIYTTPPWSGSFNFTDTIKFNISEADTSGWLFIEKKYTAIGGEKYIYIGSDKPNQSIICADSLGYYLLNAAYYFIDNVSVTENTELIVPNVFTPNNDEANDIFKTEGLRESDVIQIFNRWGIKVYETNGNAAWDGKNTSGQPCSGGIYYYVIQGTQSKTGFIHLIN